jgi:hypothetical protein
METSGSKTQDTAWYLGRNLAESISLIKWFERGKIEYEGTNTPEIISKKVSIEYVNEGH